MSLTEIHSHNVNHRIYNLMTRVKDLRGRNVQNTTGDIIAFVGLTKSGKSALINCLMGSPLICRRDDNTGVPVIVNGPGGNGPAIGDKGESETVDAKNYGHLPGTNMALWDFPGFGDNKGTDQEILNAISYQMVLRAKNSVRFVVVASYNLLDGDNSLPVFELLQQLLHICPQIANSLCIVGSKGDSKILSGLLQKVCAQQFPSVEEGRRQMIQKGKDLITKVLINGTYVDFKLPTMDEVASEERFVLPNADQIVDCIKKLKGARLGEVPLIVSHEAKNDIAQYYETCCNILKINIDELCFSLKKFMDSKGIGVTEGNASVKLAIHKNGKETIRAILAKAKDFESFFQAVKEVGIGASSEFPEYLARFIFIEELRHINDKTKGTEDFFDTLQTCLKIGLAQYEALIDSCEAIVEREKIENEAMIQKHETEISAVNKQMKEVTKTSQESVDRAAAAQANAEARAKKARTDAERVSQQMKKISKDSKESVDRALAAQADAEARAERARADAKNAAKAQERAEAQWAERMAEYEASVRKMKEKDDETAWRQEQEIDELRETMADLMADAEAEAERGRTNVERVTEAQQRAEANWAQRMAEYEASVRQMKERDNENAWQLEQKIDGLKEELANSKADAEARAEKAYVDDIQAAATAVEKAEAELNAQLEYDAMRRREREQDQAERDRMWMLMMALNSNNNGR